MCLWNMSPLSVVNYLCAQLKYEGNNELFNFQFETEIVNSCTARNLHLAYFDAIRIRIIPCIAEKEPCFLDLTSHNIKVKIAF